MHSKCQLQMEVTGQMHIPAAVSVGEEHMVATGWAHNWYRQLWAAETSRLLEWIKHQSFSA